MKDIDEIAQDVSGVAIRIHGELVPGLLEGLRRIVNDYIPSASPRLRANE